MISSTCVSPGNPVQEKSPSPGAAGAVGHGSLVPPAHHACAACHHQRKKCTETCDLAPYLPIAKKDNFGALQRVYGVSNLTKLLKDAAVCNNHHATSRGKIADATIAHRNRLAAVEAMVWEAKMRLQDPIHGSYGAYVRMRNEIGSLRAIVHQQGVELRRQRDLDYFMSNDSINVNSGCSTINGSLLDKNSVLFSNGGYSQVVPHMSNGCYGTGREPMVFTTSLESTALEE